MRQINEVQKLLLQLMENASFNIFDGVRVADALRQNADLWEAAILWRPVYNAGITLRDLGTGHYSADCLNALVPEEKLDEFLRLPFRAQEICWRKYDGTQGGNVGFSPEEVAAIAQAGPLPGVAVVRVWWD